MEKFFCWFPSWLSFCGGVLPITLKPRLLIATDNFLPRWDGVSRFLMSIIPLLAEDFTITIIGPDYGSVDTDYFRMIKIPLRKGHLGDYRPAKLKYFLIKKEIKKHDIIFTQTIGPVGMCALIAARKVHRPVISYVHSLEERLVPMAVGPNPLRKILFPFMRWFTRWIYNKSQLLITPSVDVEDQLSWNGISTHKVVVPLGVDTALFSPGTASFSLRKRLGIGVDDVVIGQHGRLAHEKDLKTLLRGFIRLRAKHKNVKLLIIADGLKSIKKFLKKQPGVILAGKQDDVVSYLRLIDIFALTSLTETTSLASLEAMSCGIPVVSTPVGFVNEYIEDGVNGFFFPFKDSHLLEKKLDLLVQNPSLRKKIGARAREMVLKNFSWEKTSDDIRKLLLTYKD